jgi:hypothetical protein
MHQSQFLSHLTFLNPVMPNLSYHMAQHPSAFTLVVHPQENKHRLCVWFFWVRGNTHRRSLLNNPFDQAHFHGKFFYYAIVTLNQRHRDLEFQISEVPFTCISYHRVSCIYFSVYQEFRHSVSLLSKFKDLSIWPLGN